jgi:signal transduction histidine kinase
MSSEQILHFMVPDGDRPLPWELGLSRRRIVLLKARSPREAAAMGRAYPLMMILADLTTWDESCRKTLEELQNADEQRRRPPVVGLLRFDPTPEQRAELSACMDALVHESDPERALLWPIEMLKLIGELSQFEQSRLDVNQLAQQTRQMLHDLSQPLSALQGRLQLMAAKAAEDDPNAECLRDLVRLIFEVSRQVMELQRVHRVFT